MPSIANIVGMLYFLACEADLIAYDFGSGGMELTLIFCKLKGA